METNDKYYVPSIEEFHVGFEYYGWIPIKGILPKYIFTSKTNLKMIENTPNAFTCKYLDKEDIESLGWVYSPSIDDDDEHEGSYGNMYYKIIRNNTDYEQSIQYHLSHRISDNIVFIDMYNEFGNLKLKTMIGYITIKNKSELKKIMQMLNMVL